jgi:hypothetical protein
VNSPANSGYDLLLAQYISSFERFDELSGNPDIYPIIGALALGRANDYGHVAWRPRRTEPQDFLMEPIYSKLPAKFPALFERLLLTFRWADVSLDRYTLMANPPGSDLDGFFQGISKDPGLWEALIPAGYLRFGKGPDVDYDPVCFDMNSRNKNREIRIAKIDHREILYNYRVKVVAELAPSFEALILQTIESANKIPMT